MPGRATTLTLAYALWRPLSRIRGESGPILPDAQYLGATFDDPLCTSIQAVRGDAEPALCRELVDVRPAAGQVA